MTTGHRDHRESGAALLIVLVAGALVAALAFAAVVVSETEQRIEGTFEWTLKARSAADAAMTRAVDDLSAVVDWTTILGGNPLGPLDTASRVTDPASVLVDLSAAGAALQADTDGRASGSLNRPIWRRVEAGPLATLTGAAGALEYAAVWIADDWWEADNDPAADSNGVLLAHVEVWGIGGAHAVVEATVAHGPVEPGCGLSARNDYGSGRPVRVNGPWAVPFPRGSANFGPGIVLAAWHASDPGDPCHLRGPGAIIVTWRELS